MSDEEPKSASPFEGRNTHPKALPNYQNAVIPPGKLEQYALNPRHESRVYGKSSGKDKARVFKAALGFDETNSELLQQRILEELPYYEAIVGDEDEYGKRYNVTILVLGPSGNTANVLTAWIIRPGTDFPSLTTLYCEERG